MKPFYIEHIKSKNKIILDRINISSHQIYKPRKSVKYKNIMILIKMMKFFKSKSTQLLNGIIRMNDMLNIFYPINY